MRQAIDLRNLEEIFQDFYTLRRGCINIDLIGEKPRDSGGAYYYMKICDTLKNIPINEFSLKYMPKGTAVNIRKPFIISRIPMILPITFKLNFI